MRHTLSTLLYLRKYKKDQNGLIPIYLRIKIDGKRSDISTNRKIDPTNWDTEASCMKRKSEEANILNNHLSNLKALVNKHSFQFPKTIIRYFNFPYFGGKLKAPWGMYVFMYMQEKI